MVASSEIEIRAALSADMTSVAEIYRQEVIAGTATFETQPPDAGEMEARLEAVTAAGYPWLVAVTEGRCAGYAYANSFRSRPAFRNTVENSVYVAVDQRGSGIGRALLARLIDECAARGFRQMVAVIGDSASQQRSIRLHAGLGFETVGTMPDIGWKQGRWLDVVLMQRKIGSGATTAPRM